LTWLLASYEGLRHDDHGVQPGAVAHRDHHRAPLVIEIRRGRDELRRRFRGQGGVLRLRRRGGLADGGAGHEGGGSGGECAGDGDADCG
jgi:hypothetical protein